MDEPREFPFREFRVTVYTAAPVDALAETLAGLCGAASVHSIRTYWDTKLPELGVASQEGWRVEVIADPIRMLITLDRIGEWASTVGASLYQVEIQPTCAEIYRSE